VKAEPILNIPIAEVRVLNPRSRNRKTFQGIVANIGAVGLKKPITVFVREPQADGTRYDLVCGQGRLEAAAALGSKTIPAIVTEAPLEERYLMSLVENVARKRPPLSDLVREVKRLKEAGDSTAKIAQKLGMGHTHVEGIVHLLNCGEDRLVERVEAGTIPLTVAVQIATASDTEVQRALSEAYERGELRGAKLFAVQKIIAARAKQQNVAVPAALSRKDFANTYDRETKRHRELTARAAVVRERLALLTAALQRLFSDEAFLQVLASENLAEIPAQLAVRIG
jgi:ParB family transcriptional regulator, chromosome partitioning protein